ncbi:hypothetical protein EYF80_039043 [Liparis tanakae]|uniref:Uncharacterized protein n=1 Tax=Liparis tanakae TaxID=230148 RepID=A0A4Z2GDH8_9TELE|nr:hypothetical protein EYF80_039043 [Liparis tanakae]
MTGAAIRPHRDLADSERGSAIKRVQHSRRTLGFSGGSLDRKHTSFPRMYIKASYPSGGISTGNRRDSPHEDDDITFIVFFVFHPPPNLQPV